MYSIKERTAKNCKDPQAQISYAPVGYFSGPPQKFPVPFV